MLKSNTFLQLNWYAYSVKLKKRDRLFLITAPLRNAGNFYLN